MECTMWNNLSSEHMEGTYYEDFLQMIRDSRATVIANLSVQPYLPPICYMIHELYSKDHHQYLYTYLVSSLKEWMILRKNNKVMAPYTDNGHSDPTMVNFVYMRRMAEHGPQYYAERPISRNTVELLLKIEDGLLQNYRTILDAMASGPMNV